MENTQIRDFTSGNITKQLIVFAWPLFLSNLLQIVYNMVDMVVVGHALGRTGLSAVAVGGDVCLFLTFLSIGFCGAGQVLIAQLIGSKQQDKIARFVGTMSGFLTACVAALTILSLFFQPQILQLMNTPQEAYEGAVAYSTVCMVGLFFIYGYNAVSAILRGMGDSKHPFVFIAIAAVLNLILDLVFVLGFGMGPGGAALATVISQAVSFLCCLWFLWRNKDAFKLQMRPVDLIRWDHGMLMDLLKLGTPMAIKSASVLISKLFVNAWINSYGIAVSAFAGIANKFSSIANLVSSAMNTAGSTLVGQNIAAREFGRVRKILARMAAITLTISTVLSAVVCIFPMQVFSIFTDDLAVLELVPGYLPIAVLLLLASALRAVLNALINGSGHSRINFVTAILDGIVMRIGLALLFGLALDMRHYGFWLGDALAGFTPFLIGVVFYFTGKWKEKPVRIGK